MSCNKITSKGALALTSALERGMCKIKTVKLVQNLIDDEMMDSIADSLVQNYFLHCLDLGENNISDKGVKLFADNITGNVNLITLNLERNINITDMSVPSFVHISNVTSITTITLWNTNVSQENIVKINRHLCVPVSTRETPIPSKSKSAAKSSNA